MVRCHVTYDALAHEQAAFVLRVRERRCLRRVLRDRSGLSRLRCHEAGCRLFRYFVLAAYRQAGRSHLAAVLQRERRFAVRELHPAELTAQLGIQRYLEAEVFLFVTGRAAHYRLRDFQVSGLACVRERCCCSSRRDFSGRLCLVRSEIIVHCLSDCIGHPCRQTFDRLRASARYGNSRFAVREAHSAECPAHGLVAQFDRKCERLCLLCRNRAHYCLANRQRALLLLIYESDIIRVSKCRAFSHLSNGTEINLSIYQEMLFIYYLISSRLLRKSCITSVFMWSNYNLEHIPCSIRLALYTGCVFVQTIPVC